MYNGFKVVHECHERTWQTVRSKPRFSHIQFSFKREMIKVNGYWRYSRLLFDSRKNSTDEPEVTVKLKGNFLLEE
jgi:hypothetical protein